LVVRVLMKSNEVRSVKEANVLTGPTSTGEHSFGVRNKT
jgi:hypothetical protein